jgi:large subunit ribosomal protein L33
VIPCEVIANGESLGYTAAMAAKGNRVIVRLVSSAGTGYIYSTMKNRRNTPERMRLQKYDPVARRKVEFVESK